MIREVQQGKANSELNYWLGMAEGTVALAPYSGLVSEETIRAVEDAKEEILSGWEVFSGVIYDNQGELRCSEKEVISDTMLLENFSFLLITKFKGSFFAVVILILPPFT